MIKKINQYLLTHYPLLWNTKFVWVITANILLHVMFLLAGIASVGAGNIKNFYTLSSPGGDSLMIFSILCSMAVLITWLLFYLRNNAFKNFYTISKWHLIKEALIVAVIIFSSITQYESFCKGVQLKTRSITSKQELINEANTINLAKAFIPQDKGYYFILNTRDSDGTYNDVYHSGTDYSDSINNTTDTSFARVKAALKLPNAFSYSNYSDTYILLNNYQGFSKYPAWYNTKNNWIKNEQRDSIKAVLNKFVAICGKYNIEGPLNIDDLTALVFQNPYHNITRLIPTDWEDNNVRNPYYISLSQLQNVMSFIDGCHLSTLSSYRGQNDFIQELTIELYITLSLAIILLCYRWYNKKVFLISFIGGIVWCIIFASIGIGSRGGDVVSYLYLILFSIFLVVAVVNLRNNRTKTLSGVFLSWSITMMPYLIMCILALCSTYYYNQRSYYSGLLDTDDYIQRTYPISYWIHAHNTEIIFCNLFFAFAYLIFYFSHLSKKWHIIPEE